MKKEAKAKKVKEPLVPQQKKIMKIMAYMIGALVVLGMALSILAWFDII